MVEYELPEGGVIGLESAEEENGSQQQIRLPPRRFDPIQQREDFPISTHAEREFLIQR